MRTIKQAAKQRVVAAAIKKPSGKVITKPLPAHHRDIAAVDRKGGGTGHGKRGFIAEPIPKRGTGDKFVGRQTAKRIAGKNGQARVRGRRGLHSEDLI